MKTRTKDVASKHGIPAGMKPEPDVVAKGYIIRKLSSIKEVPQELVDLLGIPDRIVQAGEWSYSTDPESSAGLRYKLSNGQPLGELPDYSLSVDNEGSKVYLTLVDAKRRIVVSEMVQHDLVEESGFATFQKSLEIALGHAKSHPKNIAVVADQEAPRLV